MNAPKSIFLAFVLTVLGGILLAGCGSGDADVDQKALDARNSQRAGAAPGGAPPANAPAKGK